MPAGEDSDIYRGPMRPETPLNTALCKLWYRMWQLAGFSNSGDEGGGTQQSPTWAVSTSANFAVVAGKKSVSFITSSDWDGTLLGAALPASASVSFTADQFRTLAGFTGTRSAGTIYIGTLGS